jgi:hypothetical protein
MQRKLHRELVQSLTDNTGYVYTDNTQSSRLFGCIRPVPIDIVEKTQGAAIEAVSGNFLKKVVPLIDPNLCDELVTAIITLVESDDAIKGDTIINEANQQTKQQLVSSKDFTFYELLAGVFKYATVVPNNTDGKNDLEQVKRRLGKGLITRRAEITVHRTTSPIETLSIINQTVELSTKAQSNELSLLIEVNSCCPLCHSQLVLEKNGQSVTNYRATSIFPKSVSLNMRQEFEKIPRLTNNLDSYENTIMLCPGCSAKYQANTTFDEYQKLVSIKSSLLREKADLEKARSLPLDDQIAEVVGRIAELPGSDVTNQKFDVVEVKKKIYPEFFLLERKTRNYIVENYPYVRELFAQLDGKGSLRFRRICRQVNNAYLDYADDGNLFEQQDQDKVFDALVAWLMHAIGSNHRIACEIMIAFFIQNCEVFDAIAE